MKQTTSLSLQEIVASNIKRFRRARGFTQREFAEQLNVSYSLVQKYELGLSTPPLNVWARISDVLGIPPHILLRDLSHLSYDELRQFRKKHKEVP